MRYNPPVRPSQERANSWVGKVVRTTTNRLGDVQSVKVEGTSIKLYCIDAYDLPFITDNEHATIVRDDVK